MSNTSAIGGPCIKCGRPNIEHPGGDCPRHPSLGASLLRPATRPPKPRLRPCMGIWTCETASLIAKGRTPAEAYREWQKAVAIAGAAVMRSLRPFA